MERYRMRDLRVFVCHIPLVSGIDHRDEDVHHHDRGDDNEGDVGNQGCELKARALVGGGLILLEGYKEHGVHGPQHPNKPNLCTSLKEEMKGFGKREKGSFLYIFLDWSEKMRRSKPEEKAMMMMM